MVCHSSFSLCEVLTDNLGLLYNLYGDKLLGLNLVPQSIYDMQSTFYPTVVQNYGVPLDTRNAFTKCKFNHPRRRERANADCLSS